MAHPLSPLSPAHQNLRATEREVYTSKTWSESYIIHQDQEDYTIQSAIGLPSSPFDADIDTENHSPAQRRSSGKQQSPRKPSPHGPHTIPLTEKSLRDNEGLTKAIDVMQSEGAHSRRSSELSNEAISVMDGPHGYGGVDDTCFSTFSAVPNADMPPFAKFGQSLTMSGPTSPEKSSRKLHNERDVPVPRYSRPTTPGTSRRRDNELQSPESSPTPRRPGHVDSGDTTNLILDFTEQFSAFAPSSNQSPIRNARPSPSKFHTQPNLATSDLRAPASAHNQPPRTPAGSRNLANLLDFDLTPAPTPRSIPTISAREVEKLKSSFLSQISSLRATLNGKEAEIDSLKEAIGDAERRVGEAYEELGEQRNARETLQADKTEWQKRDNEMQQMLRAANEALVRGDREREELRSRTEEAEKRKEESEARSAEAHSRIAGMEAGSAAVGATGNASTPGSGSNKAVEAAVEKVARELHTLYKSKHETKVGALKKSYEGRWEKKLKELQAKVDDLSKENEELKIARDAIMSGVAPSILPSSQGEEEQQKEAAFVQRLEEEQAKLAFLSREMETMRRDNETMHRDLEKERIEKGELVAAAEEMLSIQATALQPSSLQLDNQAPPGAENLRGSVSRTSGLKGPGFSSSTTNGESRIGMMASRSTSGTGMGIPRSGIMSNIERMGRGRVAE